MSRPSAEAVKEQPDAFLTALDFDVVPIRQKVKDERLNQVRKDHKKLMDIIGQFGNKVGGMIDKQRYEFMNAYEQHIQDAIVAEFARESSRDFWRGVESQVGNRWILIRLD